MIGELSKSEIEGVLHGNVVGRIGCHANGKTYVVPVTYAYDGDRVICHSAEGRKIKMMRDNPEVCFEVEQIQDLANWRSVIAWGRFEELHGSEAASGMGLLVDRLLPLMKIAAGASGHNVTPHGQQPGESTVVYSIRLSEKTGRFEKR
ncbi:MAG TPA: pyridoxamine 5'-phosphate oxidase family protein [Fimbriimonadaceae bacterium]|nr:pyridoxamine 5'-phosphate oxidase family protein [Fimbriimonadaceae bacterium]